MKITFLVGTFPVISEQFIQNQIVGLLDKGIDVNILALRKSSETKYHKDFFKYSLDKKVQYLDIPGNSFLRYFKGFCFFIHLLFMGKFRPLWLAISVKKFNRSTLSLKNIYILHKLYKSKIKINILHCHFGPQGVTGSFLKEAGLVDKLIVTFHGSDINTYPKKHGKDVYSFMYNNADHITCNTNFTAEKVIRNGCDKKKISIIPVGLKISDFDITERRDEIIQPVFLTIARLVEKKGYPYALEAMFLMKKTYPELKYHIVGADGPLKPKLLDLIDEYKLSENVIMHGLLSKQEITRLYSEADVFILPSITASDGDMEGQGLVLQEAQAVGIPVISTIHNGIPDGILDGTTGYLVPEKDSEALAEKCLLLVSDPEVIKKMASECRKFVEGKYDIPVLTDQILKVYKD